MSGLHYISIMITYIVMYIYLWYSIVIKIGIMTDKEETNYEQYL